MTIDAHLPTCVVVGPPEHGVTRLAGELAEAAGAPVQVQRRLEDAPPPAGPHHLHLTPRLCGATPEDAADNLLVWWDGAGERATLTLHDLPQPSDGAEMFPRRARCVARWAEAARAVAVSSRHEALLLADIGVDETPEVIPLPLDRAPHPGGSPDPSRGLAVLGFVYPGKGHDQAIRAAAAQRPPVPVEVLGGVADGHDDLLDDLAATASGLGVELRAAGYLPEDELGGRLVAAGVPVALHQHLSASGSINSWVAYGRRPIVLGNRYTREVAALRPGTLWVVEPDEVVDAVAAALADPGRTQIDPDHPVGPGTAEVVAAYRRFWERVT